MCKEIFFDNLVWIQDAKYLFLINKVFPTDKFSLECGNYFLRHKPLFKALVKNDGGKFY